MLHQALAEHRLQLDGYTGEDGLGDHGVEHGGYNHIIRKRTKGNHTRPKIEMTGQDSGRKARLAGIALF